MNTLIKKLIADIKNKPELADSMSDTADILNDIGLDSLQIITFILQLETIFSVEFDFDNFDYSHLSSITALSDFIKKQKARI
jgi:acyl carrier protein